MKGWKDISQELNEVHKKILEKSDWNHKDCVSSLLKELITQFKEIYEIEDDVEDDFVINVRDIRQLIWEFERAHKEE